MHDPKKLWEEIEQLQELLHETVSKKGIDSPETNRVIHDFRNKMLEYNNAVSRCDNKNRYYQPPAALKTRKPKASFLA